MGVSVMAISCFSRDSAGREGIAGVGT